ncbi:hypothetical protein N7491_005467 [Penicillium cf. griseofulvum]|uniref:Uncharacterized protein n=1 Tax=Penicillium cf. griseofulvum TaxID=2972120 RepID=A0A9W9M503_9EURO|nr:hypothetical protein N7472_008157 [Penicillium cf. griseofulvum]KAJ5434872.1 hypothetical protein N7491_005467 [Penicillium cf. griseofulvum]KAJ5452704.1 hypothetical protein N7445_000887 [Penicillium cf. griseofulvum]
MASHSSLDTSEKPSEALLPFGVFSPPKNAYEWKRALADVKWLCFNQQYKQCALRCNQLIEAASNPLHPIRATYLHYYAATSYESMGRAAHIFSAVKVPLLTSAMERFQIAYESLPATIPLPALNPNQTYSPVTFLHSPDSSPRSSVTTVVWSPPLLDHAIAGPGPHSEALSVENLSAHNASMARTPPMPVPYSSSSSNSSITTDFCVTPPPATREVSRLDYNAPPPAFHIPPPTRKPPPPPPGVSPRTATRNELVSFNSARDGLPNGGSIVRNIARMIDNSIMAGANDPFMTHAPAKPRIPSQPPVRLSPVKFWGQLEDPVKRSELIPPPLAIRKSSGEVVMCNNSTMAICGGPEQESSKFEVNRPIRARPPRLPLKIIPSARLNANTEKPASPTLAPRPKRLSPVQLSSMTSPPSTPSPVLRKKIPFGSPFISRAGSPGPKSTKSPSLRSTKPSPAPVSAARTVQINEFNNAVKWLREHIPADVTGLRKQIKHVSELQQARRSRNTTMTRSASFWTFSPVKSKPGEPQEPPMIEGPNIDEYGNVIRIETKAQRIKRLREEDWRIGIRSKHSLWKGTEYYDNLCATALAELGETGYGSREWLKR